jgi:hypothetical protein
MLQVARGQRIDEVWIVQEKSGVLYGQNIVNLTQWMSKYM